MSGIELKNKNTELIEHDGNPSSPLAVMAKEEFTMKVLSAKKFPRVPSESLSEVRSMVTISPEIASQMFYCLPRANKKIFGPSIRLAEVFLLGWGNVIVEDSIVDENDKVVVAEGKALDLQNNITIKTQVSVRITNKDGKKYNDDMIATAKASALAKARRNAIFQIVPKTYIEQVWNECRSFAAGESKTLEERKDKAFNYLINTMGLSEERILFAIKKPDRDNVGKADIEVLLGLTTSVREGAEIDEIFPPLPKDEQKEAFDNPPKNKSEAKKKAGEKKGEDEKDDMNFS